MTNSEDWTNEESQDYCRPDSMRLAGGLLNIARNKSHPVQYRYDSAQWARLIYAESVDENDRRWLAVQSVVAYTMPETSLLEKAEAFAALIQIQSRLRATDKQRSSALGNLARLYHRLGRYSEAADLYRQAREFVCIGESGRDYLDSQLADCLARLGDCFGLPKQGCNECAPEFLDEPVDDEI